MIGLIRLILASAALLIIYLDPAEPDRFVPATYTALAVYFIYSLVLYLTARFKEPKLKWRFTWAHWVDVFCYTVLIALSSGTNSIFFSFFYFSILIASFRWGFRSGMLVTLVSTILFTTVGYLSAPVSFDLNRFLFRPISLLALGYMTAYWGGFELELRRRLKFLRDVTRLSNPRFGVDRTIHLALEQLRAYYDADLCMLIECREENSAGNIRRISRSGENSGVAPISAEAAAIFLSVPPGHALIQRRRSHTPLIYDIEANEILKSSAKNEALVNILESKPFLSVPINYRSETIARLYVVGGRADFRPTEVDFILQAVEQLIPVLDNIRLVDSLASNAAERERERIARDLHDSVVQPYIGLQLGLAAIGKKVERGDSDVASAINSLVDLTTKGLAELRHYVGEIKTGERDTNTLLIPAIRRFAARFSEATAIKVNVEAGDHLSVSDRLAAELFQMITEGLSNVRRHTEASVATIVLVESDEDMTLRIENDSNDRVLPFHPRSLAERAASLGGVLTVDLNGRKNTIVNIQIPL
ncbi:MAG TPA: histidine kinase [Pyrinomonadaceae bacterium]|jgi:signal transduction histidine kinase|nr:histidine kinase [Pyrinomonadaceae bacterium]